MRHLKHNNTLLIVTGCPGTGKSFWAGQICTEFENITVLSYDRIKERNFDKYGFNNKAEKDVVNARSLEEFFSELEALMRLSRSILIEYPFYQRHKEKLASLVDRYHYHAITLFLYGDMRVIYERGKKRDLAGDRHLGHLQNCYHKGDVPAAAIDPEVNMTLKEFIEVCSHKDYDIQIGQTIRIDVTDIQRTKNMADTIFDKIVELS